MIDDSRTILVVDDEGNDVFLLEYAFEAAGIINPLHCIDDGQKAVDYLGGVGKYSNRSEFPMPCLVLLDLKLPARMGFDVLRWIRDQRDLQTLIVIVLSSSKDKRDVDEAYRLGARSYLVKPLSVKERLEIARAIKFYWLEISQLPTLGGCNTSE